MNTVHAVSLVTETKFTVILYLHLGLPNSLYASGFLAKTCMHLPLCACYVPCQSHLPLLEHSDIYD
jgi:hypothetical protein